MISDIDQLLGNGNIKTVTMLSSYIMEDDIVLFPFNDFVHILRNLEIFLKVFLFLLRFFFYIKLPPAGGYRYYTSHFKEGGTCVYSGNDLQ